MNPPRRSKDDYGVKPDLALREPEIAALTAFITAGDEARARTVNIARERPGKRDEEARGEAETGRSGESAGCRSQSELKRFGDVVRSYVRLGGEIRDCPRDFAHAVVSPRAQPHPANRRRKEAVTGRAQMTVTRQERRREVGVRANAAARVPVHLAAACGDDAGADVD